MHDELTRDSQIRLAITTSLQLVRGLEALDALHRACIF